MTSAVIGIDEYLRDRLMPVEGSSRIYPESKCTAIRFRPRRSAAICSSTSIFSSATISTPVSRTPAGYPRSICSPTHRERRIVIPSTGMEWLKSRPEYRPELEAAYREVRRLERLRVAENLAGLYDTAGVLLVDAQDHGIIAPKIASTVHDTFHAFMLTELDRYGTTTTELFENLNLSLARSGTARDAPGRMEQTAARELPTGLYGEVHPSGHIRFVNFGHPPPLLFSADSGKFAEVDRERMVRFLPLGLEVPGDHPDRKALYLDAPQAEACEIPRTLPRSHS